jgi:Methylamine utilization protein MauJ
MQMRCFADFILDSDLCLKQGAEPLVLTSPTGGFTLTLANAEHDANLLKSVLSAHLVFDAPSFDNIRQRAFEVIAEAINVLTFTTNRKFVVVLLKRIIDWTPGIVDRSAIIFVETPEWDTAESGLDQRFIDSAQRLLAMSSGSEQHEAMRWYRKAIQAPILEEQFSYFWFALEIVAERLKGTEKVPSKCPHCQSALYCEACDKHPVHARYAGDAIKQLVERVHPQDSDEVFKALQKIRHTLAHGGQIAQVVGDLPCTGEQALNKLAFVTWQAIYSTFTNADPDPETPLNLGYVDNFARRTIVGGARVTVRMGGDPNNPDIKDFPNVDFTVRTLDVSERSA